MLRKHYVNNHPQPNGDNEVHVEGCDWLRQARSSTYLGSFARCQEAVEAAQRFYPRANGCAFCCPECHTR